MGVIVTFLSCSIDSDRATSDELGLKANAPPSC
jgi:hypothetical protein